MVRVLIIHNSYQQAGGEDAVVTNEHALLDGHGGWETRLWIVSNDSITGAWTKIATAMRTPYSRAASDRLAAVIADFSPAIVHVHNFFPLLTPSVYDACRTAGVAVVQTLHNYRTICAGSLLQRDGHACEDCIGASPYQAVLHGCYRGSRIGSLPVARMIDVHRRRGTWLRKVDRFIALSAFAKSKFVAAGFPADKIVIKPHFTQDRPVARPAARAGALYVGRLSAEKGITILLRAWRDIEVPLRVVGDGPLRGLVERAAGSKIVAVGWRTPAKVAEEMARAAWLIVPSVVPENFGLVIIEAFSQALPVIASRTPTLEGTVNDGDNGLLFATGDAGDLTSKVRWAVRHPEAMRNMGIKARQAYEEKFSPSVNLRQLTRIYEAAIEEARSAGLKQPVSSEFAIGT